MPLSYRISTPASRKQEGKNHPVSLNHTTLLSTIFNINTIFVPNFFEVKALEHKNTHSRPQTTSMREALAIYAMGFFSRKCSKKPTWSKTLFLLVAWLKNCLGGKSNWYLESIGWGLWLFNWWPVAMICVEIVSLPSKEFRHKRHSPHVHDLSTKASLTRICTPNCICQIQPARIRSAVHLFERKQIISRSQNACFSKSETLKVYVRVFRKIDKFHSSW